MNKLNIALLTLLLTTPIIEGDKKNAINSTAKGIVTFATIVAGSWLAAKAINKGYERGMKEYLLRNSLEDLCIRAKNDIETVEKSIGTEIKLECNAKLLSILRSKYTGELFPLYYANELIIKMKNDIILDKYLLITKATRIDEAEKIIDTEQLIADLDFLEERLNNTQEFLSHSYEYKIEQNELKNLQSAVAYHHHINHTHCCGY